MSDNYTIVIDTNVLGDYKKGDLVCKNFKYLSVDKFVFLELIKYIAENNLSDAINLKVPKIVLEELKEQQRREYNKAINNLDTIFSQFSELDDFILQKATDLDYDELLSNTADSFMRKHNIEVIDYPDNSVFPKLIKKVIKKYKPFYKNKNTDSGFKDAILWESLLAYAKNNVATRFILFSNDSDFKDKYLLEEFRKTTNTDIEIKETLAEVKSFVEEVLHQNMEFNIVLKLVSLNLIKIYQFIRTHIKSVLCGDSSYSIIDFKIYGDIKDISIDRNTSELLLPVNVVHENKFMEYANYSGEQYYYVPDEYTDTLKLTIEKDDDLYNLTKVEFLSKRIQSIQNIFLELDVEGDSK